MTLCFDHIKALEVTPKKTLICAKNRKKVVDWMIQVTSEDTYYFDDTVHFAVSYMDRYLEKKNCKELVKLAATCIFIASKFNDVCPTSIGDVLQFSSKWDFTKQELIDFEFDVLDTLNFELAKPNIKTFLSEHPCTLNIMADKALMITPFKKASEVAQDIIKNTFEVYIPQELVAINEKYKKCKKRKR